MSRFLPVPRYVCLAALLATALGACEPKEATAAHDGPAPLEAAPLPAAEAAPAALTLVADASQVCMVNDQFMGRPQIPVQVEGKTYYGCCAMCKGRLESDASGRTAIDPVSRTPVDKATAVIGKTQDGSALYFANKGNFDDYARRAP